MQILKRNDFVYNKHNKKIYNGIEEIFKKFLRGDLIIRIVGIIGVKVLIGIESSISRSMMRRTTLVTLRPGAKRRPSLHISVLDHIALVVVIVDDSTRLRVDQVVRNWRKSLTRRSSLVDARSWRQEVEQLVDCGLSRREVHSTVSSMSVLTSEWRRWRCVSLVNVLRRRRCLNLTCILKFYSVIRIHNRL